MTRRQHSGEMACAGSSPSCVGICVVLGGATVLEDASLEVERGEVHVLIGPNGAGKTTLANVITGHGGAVGGEVTLDGALLTGAP